MFYNKLVLKLKEHSFKTNEYDPCVATKLVDGKQMTITWHVDDLKISNVDREVVDKALSELRAMVIQESHMVTIMIICIWT